MTFQEAQQRFDQVAGTVRMESTPQELTGVIAELVALQGSLPLSDELDPVADAIAWIMPKLSGALTRSVIDDLRSRTSALADASALLDKTARRAATDARSLSFEKPGLMAAGLAGCIEAAREMRTAAKARDLAVLGAKAEALFAQLTQLQGTIKVG